MTELLNKCAEHPDLLDDTIAYHGETDKLVTRSENDANTVKTG